MIQQIHRQSWCRKFDVECNEAGGRRNVLADRAGDSLHEIVNISQKVTQMVSQIAVANEEQSSTSEQISKIWKPSLPSPTNSIGTQQIARTAEDLNRLTESLQNLVNQFRLTSQKRFGTVSLPSQSLLR